MAMNVNVNIENINFLSELNGTIANLGVNPFGKFFLKPRVESSDSEKVVLATKNILFELNKNPDDFLNRAKINTKVFISILLDKILPSKILNAECFFQLRNIQNILVPKLSLLRVEKEKAGFKKTEAYKMKKAVAKAKLMFMLKIGITVNKGCSGSLLISWFNLKKIGIFKAELPKENCISWFRGYIESALGLQESHLTTSHMAKPKAEVAAYILDRHFNFNITCATSIQTFNKNEGSFQLFAQNMCEAREIKHLLEEKFEFEEQEIYNFQLMVVLDYLMGDLDGHEENWLVKKGKKGCLIKKIKKIDNANAFIQKNPENWILSSFNDLKQYIWSELKIAKIGFQEPIKELMLKITKQEIEIVINKIKNQLPNFLDTDIIRLLYQRASVLEIIGGLPDASPSMFGKLKSENQIETFITDNSLPKATIHSISLNDDDFYDLAPPSSPRRQYLSEFVINDDYSD